MIAYSILSFKNRSKPSSGTSSIIDPIDANWVENSAPSSIPFLLLPCEWRLAFKYFRIPSADASSLGISVVSDLWLVSLRSFKQLFVVMVFWPLLDVFWPLLDQGWSVVLKQTLLSCKSFVAWDHKTSQDAAMVLCQHTKHYIQHVEWTPSWVSHTRNHNDWRNTQGANKLIQTYREPRSAAHPQTGWKKSIRRHDLKLVLSGICCPKWSKFQY